MITVSRTCIAPLYLTRRVMGDVDIAISSPWNRCSKAVFPVMKNIYYSTIYTIIYIIYIRYIYCKVKNSEFD